MSEYSVTVSWNRNSPEFLKGKYSREHTWSFDGGASIPASSSPNVVPLPYSNPKCVDPEEAYVASLSGCHMLTFLAICARKRLFLEAYEDEASGWLEKGEGGKLWMTRVVLRPCVRFADGTAVSESQLTALHHQAHVECFIANSVKTDVSVEPRP